MRSFRLCFCLIVVLSFVGAVPASAQNSNINLPPVMTTGLDAYRNVGLDQAFRTWLRNSPLHWVPAMAAPLHAAQEEYGNFQSWDVIGSRTLAPTTEIVYLVFNYQQGPAFAKFTLYRTEDQGWVITDLKFSLNDDAILPAPSMQ